MDAIPDIVLPDIVLILGFGFLFIVAVMSLFIPFWISRIRNEAILQTMFQKEILNLIRRLSKAGNETEKQEEKKSGFEYCFNCIEYNQLSGKCKKTRVNIDKLNIQDLYSKNPCKFKYFKPKSEKRSIS